MVDALRARGFRVLLVPSVEIAPPRHPEPLRRALTRLPDFDWVVFTSAAGVGAVTGMIRERAGGGDVDEWPRPRRVAAVGSATADAVRRAGWEVDLLPETFTGEGLLEALRRRVERPSGTTVLLPVAEAARDVLPRGLAALGMRVTRVVAYRTRAVAPSTLRGVLEEIGGGRVDLVTFTSPSTAGAFLEALGPEALRVPAAVIGPVTAGAAEEMGYRIVGVAGEHTVEGLVAEVERVLDGGGRA